MSRGNRINIDMDGVDRQLRWINRRIQGFENVAIPTPDERSTISANGNGQAVHANGQASKVIYGASLRNAIGNISGMNESYRTMDETRGRLFRQS